MEKNVIRRKEKLLDKGMQLDLEKINLSPKTQAEAVEVIGQLVKIIIELKKENELLREQLNNNSRNSSLPPSQDIKKKKKIRLKSGRSRGGQPGHKAWQRSQVSIEKVDEIIDCKPAERCSCGGTVNLQEKFHRHQVFEIPLARYQVTEYQIYKGHCSVCRKKYAGHLPSGVSGKGFGVRAQGMVSLLTSKYRLSKRLAQAWFQDVYKMPICVGSVSNVEHTVSQSLKAIHEEVSEIVKAAAVVNVDETGYKECHKTGWAWIASTPSHTYFMLNRSRGKKVAKELIGDYQGRVIVSDRYPVYQYLPDENHQVCWAHLKRDFQKISERTGEAGRIGRLLLKVYEKIFCFWKTEYNLLTDFKKRKKRLRYFKNKMIKGLVFGLRCGHKKTARTCENILRFQNSLWHFFENENIPPTNNHAERQLRPLVISKKLSFGTQSQRGSRFIERIFTVITSCKQQGRDSLAFITDSIKAFFSGKNQPSLLLS